MDQFPDLGVAIPLRPRHVGRAQADRDALDGDRAGDRIARESPVTQAKFLNAPERDRRQKGDPFPVDPESDVRLLPLVKPSPSSVPLEMAPDHLTGVRPARVMEVLTYLLQGGRLH